MSEIFIEEGVELSPFSTTGSGVERMVRFEGRLINRHLASFVFSSLIDGMLKVNMDGWKENDFKKFVEDVTRTVVKSMTNKER